MKQNLTFAFLYNALGVPVAAGVLYPAFGILLSPMVAALAMSLSSVSVVANALRLARLTSVPATPRATAPEQTHGHERKRVVKGKRVSDRADLGGHRNKKKK